MRRFASVVLAAAFVVLSSSPGAAKTQKVRGPFMLVSLPSLGMVTWRCDPERKPGLAPGLPGLALGFRASRSDGTSNVRLHARGRTVSRRVVRPGEDVHFPWLRLRVQQLDISQFSGAGTLRAFVKVSFVLPATATYCYSYLPPRVDVRLLPRQ